MPSAPRRLHGIGEVGARSRVEACWRKTDRRMKSTGTSLLLDLFLVPAIAGIGPQVVRVEDRSRSFGRAGRVRITEVGVLCDGEPMQDITVADVAVGWAGRTTWRSRHVTL